MLLACRRPFFRRAAGLSSAPTIASACLPRPQCADTEVSAGQGGSKAVRAAALGALRRLIDAVGSAEALAFFLPGIVTGLGKALAAGGRLLAAGGGRWAGRALWSGA